MMGVITVFASHSLGDFNYYRICPNFSILVYIARHSLKIIKVDISSFLDSGLQIYLSTVSSAGDHIELGLILLLILFVAYVTE